MSVVKNWALINTSTGIVENTILWDGVSEWSPPDGFIAIQTDAASIGWSYLDGQFYPPPAIPPTDAEIITANTMKLYTENQLAASQKTALTNRVGTLQDAIELEMATTDEVEELPVRQAQLLEWKRYAIYLGRVMLQEGWALTVEWPIKPPEGMDLTVSAVAPDSPQLQ